MVRRKRSPKEIIESEGIKGIEDVYAKFPGKEMVKISAPMSFEDRWFYREHGTSPDMKKLKKLYKQYDKKKYQILHTHPTAETTSYRSLPSGADLKFFLKDNATKTMIVAQRDVHSGDLGGYFIIRKGRDFKPPAKIFSSLLSKKRKEIDKRMEQYDKDIEKGERPEEAYKDLLKISDKYDLKVRIAPVKGYRFSKQRGQFVSRGNSKKRTLESKVASVIGISLLASILFSSSVLTGFTISNLTQKTSNIMGIILFIIGLIGSLYYFKRKKQK